MGGRGRLGASLLCIWNDMGVQWVLGPPRADTLGSGRLVLPMGREWQCLSPQAP